MSAKRRPSVGRCVAVDTALAVLLPVTWLSAQALAPGGVGLTAQQLPTTTPQVFITAGRSTIVTTDFDITRISVTNPEVADAVVVKPREILVDGKAAGTISLIVWGATERTQYDVVVE